MENTVGVTVDWPEDFGWQGDWPKISRWIRDIVPSEDQDVDPDKYLSTIQIEAGAARRSLTRTAEIPAEELVPDSAARAVLDQIVEQLRAVPETTLSWTVQLTAFRLVPDLDVHSEEKNVEEEGEDEEEDEEDEEDEEGEEGEEGEEEEGEPEGDEDEEEEEGEEEEEEEVVYKRIPWLEMSTPLVVFNRRMTRPSANPVTTGPWTGVRTPPAAVPPAPGTSIHGNDPEGYAPGAGAPQRPGGTGSGGYAAPPSGYNGAPLHPLYPGEFQIPPGMVPIPTYQLTAEVLRDHPYLMQQALLTGIITFQQAEIRDGQRSAELAQQRLYDLFMATIQAGERLSKKEAKRARREAAAREAAQHDMLQERLRASGQLAGLEKLIAQEKINTTQQQLDQRSQELRAAMEAITNRPVPTADPLARVKGRVADLADWGLTEVVKGAVSSRVNGGATGGAPQGAPAGTTGFPQARPGFHWQQAAVRGPDGATTRSWVEMPIGGPQGQMAPGAQPQQPQQQQPAPQQPQPQQQASSPMEGMDLEQMAGMLGFLDDEVLNRFIKAAADKDPHVAMKIAERIFDHIRNQSEGGAT